MAGKSGLRAVPAGERRRSSQGAQSVHEAALDGDHRGLLVALRARLAKDIDSAATPAAALAALSRRLLEIAKEIELIDARDQGDDVGAAAATPDEAWPAVFDRTHRRAWPSGPLTDWPEDGFDGLLD